ncbi:MAG: glycosyltransferase family 2 protein [Lachnospiraceae bacterium]|nr:glycosyltransferase family 2 protein [Lachnospiraceae bacterium]
MQQRIRSTVVIPNYNGIDYIEKCLRSLAGEPAQIIVVDNGSTDGSREAVQQFPEVELISLDRNYGFCKAVNEGIEASKTTYVILLNNDTEVQAGFVRALEQAMEGHPEVFSGSAQIRNMHTPELIDDAGDCYCALGWAFARGKDKPMEKYQRKRRIFAACGCAAIYRRKLFREIGNFDENHFAYLEDVDMGYRAGIYGYRNFYIPEAVVYHAGSAVSGSRHNEFKVDLSAKNSVYLAYKNMPPLQLLLNMPFLLAGFAVKAVYFAKKGLGGVYCKGLCKGIKLCVSKEGREHRVRYDRENLRSYIRLQLELWGNMVGCVFDRNIVK